MVPFWIPIIIRHLMFRVPKKGTIIFDNHPYDFLALTATSEPFEAALPRAHLWPPNGKRCSCYHVSYSLNS